MIQKHVLQSDSLAFIPQADWAFARAALRFMASVEKGTAMIPADGTASGVGGSRAVYRSLAGEPYEAFVVAVHGPELVDLDVLIPGCAEPFRLTKIKFRGPCI